MRLSIGKNKTIILIFVFFLSGCGASWIEDLIPIEFGNVKKVETVQNLYCSAGIFETSISDSRLNEIVNLGNLTARGPSNLPTISGSNVDFEKLAETPVPEDIWTNTWVQSRTVLGGISCVDELDVGSEDLIVDILTNSGSYYAFSSDNEVFFAYSPKLAYLIILIVE